MKQDVNTTAQDATHSYNTALQQLGEAFHTAEVSGKQIAQQMGVARDQAAVGVQDATTAARQQAQQKSQDAQLHAQGGKSALQQGTYCWNLLCKHRSERYHRHSTHLMLHHIYSLNINNSNGKTWIYFTSVVNSYKITVNKTKLCSLEASICCC